MWLLRKKRADCRQSVLILYRILPAPPPPHFPHSNHGNVTSPHASFVIAKTPPTPPTPNQTSSPILNAPACVYAECAVHVQQWCTCSGSPSGSQSFFSARHIGALIRRFLPLKRTVVALNGMGNQRRQMFF